MENSQRLEHQQQLITEGLKSFTRADIGAILPLPINCLTPSQKDDGLHPNGVAPIQACDDKGRALIIHGNHRYFRGLERGGHIIHDVVKVRNPYLDY